MPVLRMFAGRKIREDEIANLCCRCWFLRKPGDVGFGNSRDEILGFVCVLLPKFREVEKRVHVCRVRTHSFATPSVQSTRMTRERQPRVRVPCRVRLREIV